MIKEDKYVQTQLDKLFVNAINKITEEYPHLEKVTEEALKMADEGKTVDEIMDFLYTIPVENPNKNMIIKFKKLDPAAALPKQGNPSDAGYDIVAVDDGTWDKDGRYIEYKTGLAVALPSGYHLKVAPRSSNSKYDLLLCNSEGLIDNAYRGEIKLRFKYVPPSSIERPYGVNKDVIFGRDGLCLDDIKIYKKGDRIAQLKIERTIYADFEEVAELDQTDRNEGGFGSTGR